MALKNEEIKGIRAIMIIEIIGRPPEHLIESLNKIIDQIDEEKGVDVMEKKINEPTFMKDQKNFYMTFAEIELEVDEILSLAILMFKYMPAHIEIISPELLVLSNNGWNDILNELTRRLHGYDEVARVIQMEKAILEKKLREVLESQKLQKEKKKPAGKKRRLIKKSAGKRKKE